MTAAPADDILDDLFHGAATAAFVRVAQEQKSWPDIESVRLLAYRFFEDALAEKNAVTQANIGPP